MRSQGERLADLHKNPARRNIAGHAVQLAEQNRLQSNWEDLVEAEVLTLFLQGREGRLASEIAGSHADTVP
jgi:hypothetical protein